MVDGTGLEVLLEGVWGFIVRDNCVGTVFKDTGVLLWNMSFIFLLWITNCYLVTGIGAGLLNELTPYNVD